MRRSTTLGILLGFAFLTKMQSYVAFGAALFTLIRDTLGLPSLPSSAARKRIFGYAGVMLGAAFVVALPWLTRNVSLYGLGDPLGLVRHDQVVVGQLTTRQYVSQVGLPAFSLQFLLTTFRSFWGQFGWMGVPLPQRLYLALGLVTGLVVVGLGLFATRLRRRQETPPMTTRRGMAILVVWALLTTLGYFWYNTHYVQLQGRYLFPALVPWGLAFTLGLRELVRRFPRALVISLGALALGLLLVGIATGDVSGFGIALLVSASLALAVGHRLERLRPGITIVFAHLGLAAFALVCLYAYVIPHLSP